MCGLHPNWTFRGLNIRVVFFPDFLLIKLVTHGENIMLTDHDCEAQLCFTKKENSQKTINPWGINKLHEMCKSYVIHVFASFKNSLKDTMQMKD